MPTLPVPPKRPTRPASVVALGASAGGLESLGRVLGGLPESFPASILVVLHLDPHHDSQVAPLLQNLTSLRVERARGGVSIQPGTVYVAPPDRHLELHGGKLRLTRAPRLNYSRPSVDRLFSSVAAANGRYAVGVILSGTGNDGSAGLAAIKEHGGLAVAEAASTARFAGMPEAAGRTGLVDAVLPVDQIPAFLVRALTRRVRVSRREWARLLALVEAHGGTPFSRYRPTTLQRRLQHRIAARGCRTMAAYLRLLQTDPLELDDLRASFLIKVSSFWRDPSSWRSLATELARHPRGPGLRVWSAGCATGEEPFSLALLLARHFGTGPEATWKVFATDLDEGALKVARTARYRAAQLRGVAPADLARYFVREQDAWRVGKALRDRVVFGRHDLMRNPPLSRIDLLVCRNVLMYFSPREKQRQFHRLAFALNPDGILFLGPSEAMGQVPGFDRLRHTTLFRRAGHPSSVPSPKKARPRGAAPKEDVRLSASARARRADHRLGAQQDLNDELQSRNEELETVNEELQSLNDEMSAMEEQMRGLGADAERANDFLRLLLDTSSDAVIACDADDQVLFWSKACIRMFRLSAAQAVGGKLFELVPALDTPAVRSAARKVREAARVGHASVTQEGKELVFDSLPAGGQRRRGYLLRVRSVAA
ncbi:MAG TPA: chemotaxis protein CheB [Candidatus Thermoplasmatota archaeon]|nr:chemotaxis protein CheB [Candidatus Thermoplasmatota archaeon]